MINCVMDATSKSIDENEVSEVFIYKIKQAMQWIIIKSQENVQ